MLSYLNFTDRDSEVPEGGLDSFFKDQELVHMGTKIYSRISWF